MEDDETNPSQSLSNVVFGGLLGGLIIDGEDDARFHPNYSARASSTHSCR